MTKKAMLAHKFDIDRVDYKQAEGYYIQPKLDGVRCLFTKHGAYSRNDKKFMNLAHIELALIPFFNRIIPSYGFCLTLRKYA